MAKYSLVTRRSIIGYFAGLALIPFLGRERVKALQRAKESGDNVLAVQIGYGPSWRCGTEHDFREMILGHEDEMRALWPPPWEANRQHLDD